MAEEKKNFDSGSTTEEMSQETQKETIKCCGSSKHSSGKIVLIILLVIIFFGIIAVVIGKVALGRNAGRFGMMQGRKFNTERQISSRSGYRMMGGRISGKISKIDGNNITISYNNQDLVIVIADNTAIYKSNNITSKDNLKIGDEISVLGAPNSSGQVNASAIIDQS